MRKKRVSIGVYIVSLRWLGALPVIFYKKCVSPLLPNRCCFYPSCSTYMLDCIGRHGLIKGSFFGIRRLLRCNPFAKGGFDPIPFRKGDYKWLY